MNKHILTIGLASFLLVGCSDKEEKTIESEVNVTEAVQPTTPDTAQKQPTEAPEDEQVVENNTAQEEVKEDMGTSFVKNLDTHAQEVKAIKEVTVENYQYVQRLNERFTAANNAQGGEVEAQVMETIKQLNEQAVQIAENIANEKVEKTIINAYIEESVGIVAFSADGLVQSGVKFDQVVITLNNRVYEAAIDGNRFIVDRKLVLGDKEAQPVVQILLDGKVLEELTVDTIKL